MRQHTEVSLRKLTGLTEGRFSAKLVEFFTDVERRYYSGQCGHRMIPEAILPLWIERAKDKGIPLLEVPEEVKAKVSRAKDLIGV